MNMKSGISDENPIRTRMKGALVRVLEKAKGNTRFANGPGARPDALKRIARAGGYVSLAQSGLKKIFNADFGVIETPRLDVAQPAPGKGTADTVAMLAFAITTLGPASCRAGIVGKPVTVMVEDEKTARVMRAALALSCKERPCNRLIEIAVRNAG